MNMLLIAGLMALSALTQDKPPDPARPREREARPQDGQKPPPREGQPRDGQPPREGQPRDGQPRDPARPRDGDPRPPQPPNPPMAERRLVANAEEVRGWLKDNEPETYRRLMQVQDEGRREDVMRMINEAAPRMRELNELKQRDPKGFEKVMELRRAERESMELAEQARRAPPEEREAATKKLKENLNRLFDLREENRARELVELKRRVEALEKALTERKTGKERIVENRRRELMGEKKDEDW